MRVLGIETSCDETGLAVYDTRRGLLAHALHSQVTMHEAYGGVVPELASRDHVRRVVPLARQVLAEADLAFADLDGIAYTQGPGLAGALLVGAGVACGLAAALGKPTLAIHHLEGHLLSPFLSADPPQFPFVALLVSGGHTQLMRVDGALLGAGFPASTTGTTVNRFCSSGLQAIAMAAHQIRAEGADVAIGAGVESITMGEGQMNVNNLLNSRVQELWPGIYMPMGQTAELVAERYKISREDQDRFGLRSQQRYAAVDREGSPCRRDRTDQRALGA